MHEMMPSLMLFQTTDIKKDVAVKFQVSGGEADVAGLYQQELQQLQRIPPNRHVIGYLGFGSSVLVPYLVFEYCPAGTLHALLQKVACHCLLCHG